MATRLATLLVLMAVVSGCAGGGAGGERIQNTSHLVTVPESDSIVEPVQYQYKVICVVDDIRGKGGHVTTSDDRLP